MLRIKISGSLHLNRLWAPFHVLIHLVQPSIGWEMMGLSENKAPLNTLKNHHFWWVYCIHIYIYYKIIIYLYLYLIFRRPYHHPMACGLKLPQGVTDTHDPPHFFNCPRVVKEPQSSIVTRCFRTQGTEIQKFRTMNISSYVKCADTMILSV